MTDQARHKTLAYLLALAVLTAVIAGALPRLELKPGLPLPGHATASGGLQTEDQPPMVALSISPFWKTVLAILLVAGVAYSAARLLKESKWRWKDVWRTLLPLLILIFVLGVLLALVSGPIYPAERAPADLPTPSPAVAGPPLGAVPSVLIWLVCLAMAAALVGLGLWLMFRRNTPDRLKLEAEIALQAINSGLDLGNVIVQCYWQMAQVLKQEQGLAMDADMTAREFERLLEARGVPPAPVEQLTRLFEAARYSACPPGPDDERRAVDCLTAIVRYSQAGGAH